MTNPTNHQCLNGRRCQPGDQPRTTETPNTLCDPCTIRAAHHITQLPIQHLELHAMLGDHTASANPRRQRPDSAVLVNIAIDTLCCQIHHFATLAAEIVADQLHADNPHRHHPTAHVWTCCQLISPNLPTLLPLTDIDVMVWNRGGTIRALAVTTGVEIIQELEHLSAVAHYVLGRTRTRTYRDLPCSRCGQKTVGRWTGADQYDCETCGTQFPEQDIRRHDRILLERHRRGLLHA
jgi:hypothetical protein